MRKVMTGWLLTFAVGAHAQSWISLSQQGEDNRFYIDTESIVAKGNLRRATMLANYLQAQANGAHSIKATVEFQCEEAQWRTVERSYYEQPMAEGDPQLSEAGNGEWQGVEAETVAAFTLLAVCSP
ncbi:MAG: surface-adhesin E family protein [Betaproteobacteria bacterium]